MRQTLVILYPGCISFEVLLAAELLNEAHPICVATPDGKAHQATNGLSLAAHRSFADVLANWIEFAVVLIPGGNPDSVLKNQKLHEVIQKAVNHPSAVIGAICAGPAILAASGVLTGKRIAHGYADEQMSFVKPLFTDCEMTDEPIVIDGRIITAKPWAYIDFAVSIAKVVGVLDEEKAAKLSRYYKGSPD